MLSWLGRLLFPLLRGYSPIPAPDTLAECQARTEVALACLLERLDAVSKNNEDAFLAFFDIALYRAAICERPNDVRLLVIVILRTLQSLVTLRSSKEGKFAQPRKLSRAFCSLTETTLYKLRALNGSKITDEQAKTASDFINSGKWDEGKRKFVFAQQ